MASTDDPNAVRNGFGAIKAKYRLTIIELVNVKSDAEGETDYVNVEIHSRPTKKKGKNKVFKTPSGLTFKVAWTVNPAGRTIAVKATLTQVTTGATRSSAETSAQSKSAGRGKPSDVGGHIIGHRFIGEFGIVNMFPQNTKFNNSAWKKVENEWADSIRAGNHVIVSITLTGGSKLRPESIKVSWKYVDAVSGQQVYQNSDSFKNDEFQSFDRLTKEELAQL